MNNLENWAKREIKLQLKECKNEYELGQRNQYDSDRAAIETVPSVLRWIPVTERLPKLGEKVLVSTKNTVFTQVFKHIYGTPDRWGWEHHTIKKVTAWMPLPKPWKGSE